MSVIIIIGAYKFKYRRNKQFIALISSAINMECSQCLCLYDRELHIPKILIKCGHTICQVCIDQQVIERYQRQDSEEVININCGSDRGLDYKEDQGACPDCATPFSISQALEFPVNLALLAFAERKAQDDRRERELQQVDSEAYLVNGASCTDYQYSHQKEQSNKKPLRKRTRIQSTFSQHSSAPLTPVAPKCEAHGKRIEAFCDNDKKILCIDCILNENHKSHEILSLEKACFNEKSLFKTSHENASQRESEVMSQIHRLNGYLSELEELANRNRGDISQIFNEIRNKLIERESIIKRKISETLEKEQVHYKKKITALQDQMQCISSIKEEAEVIMIEPLIETLIQAPYRLEIDAEANKKLEQLTFRKVFKPINRDQELTNLVRAILPPQLVSSLLNAQLKKKEKLNDTRKRDTSKNLQSVTTLPQYDNENRFNYRKGYLRDDRVPAFISTAINTAMLKSQPSKEGDNQQNQGLIIPEKAIDHYQSVQHYHGETPGGMSNPSTKKLLGNGGGITNRSNKVTSTSAKPKKETRAEAQTATHRIKSGIINLGSSDNSPALRNHKLGGIGQLTQRNSVFQSHQNMDNRKLEIVMHPMKSSEKHPYQPMDSALFSQSSIMHKDDLTMTQPNLANFSQALTNKRTDQSKIDQHHSLLSQASFKLEPQLLIKRKEASKSIDRAQHSIQTESEIQNYYQGGVSSQSIMQPSMRSPDFMASSIMHTQSQIVVDRPYNYHSTKKTADQQRGSNKTSAIKGTQQVQPCTGLYHSQSSQKRSGACGPGNLLNSAKRAKKGIEQSSMMLDSQNEKLFRQILQKKKGSIPQASIQPLSFMPRGAAEKRIKSKPKPTLANKGATVIGIEIQNSGTQHLVKKISPPQSVPQLTPGPLKQLDDSAQTISQWQSALSSKLKLVKMISLKSNNSGMGQNNSQVSVRGGSKKSENRYKDSLQPLHDPQFSEDEMPAHNARPQIKSDVVQALQRNLYIFNLISIEDRLSMTPSHMLLSNTLERQDVIKQTNTSFSDYQHDENDDIDEFSRDNESEGEVCSDGEYDDGRSDMENDDEEEEVIPTTQMNQIVKKPFIDSKIRRNLYFLSSEQRLSSSSIKMKRSLLKESIVETNKPKPKLTSSPNKEYQIQPEQQMYLDTHFNNESNIKFTMEETLVQQEGAAQRGGSSLIQLVTERHDETTYQIKQMLRSAEKLRDNDYQFGLVMKPKNDITETSLSQVKSSSIDIENLYRVQEEYLFVFGGIGDKVLQNIEVLDVGRGIWREFPLQLGLNLTKAQAYSINGESLAIIGGKDEFGVAGDDIAEFNMKHMKILPNDWHLPQALTNSACCSLKTGQIAVSGGNNGQGTCDTAMIVTFRKGSHHPLITHLPQMIKPREDFSLVFASDKQLYSIGGVCNGQYVDIIEVYSFEKQQRSLLSTRFQMKGHSAVSLPDGIYIFGGFDGVKFSRLVYRENKNEGWKPKQFSNWRCSQRCNHYNSSCNDQWPIDPYLCDSAAHFKLGPCPTKHHYRALYNRQGTRKRDVWIGQAGHSHSHWGESRCQDPRKGKNKGQERRRAYHQGDQNSEEGPPSQRYPTL